MTSPSTPVVSRSSSMPSLPQDGQTRPYDPSAPSSQPDARIVSGSGGHFRAIGRNQGRSIAADMRDASRSPTRSTFNEATFLEPSISQPAHMQGRSSPPQLDTSRDEASLTPADPLQAGQPPRTLQQGFGSSSAFSNVSQSTVRPLASFSMGTSQVDTGVLEPEQVSFAVRLACARQKMLTGLRDPAANGPSAACWLGISTLCLVSTTVLWTSWWMSGWREATVVGACLGAIGAFGFVSAESALTRTSQSLGDEVRPWATGRHIAMQIYWMAGTSALVIGSYNHNPGLRRAGVAVLGAAFYETDQTISRAAVLANIIPEVPPLNPNLVPPPGNPLALAFLEFGSYLWGEGQELGDLNLAVYGTYVGLAGAAMAIEKGRMMSLLFTSIGWASVGQGAVDGRWQHWAIGLGAVAVGFALNLQANIHALTIPSLSRPRLTQSSDYGSTDQTPLLSARSALQHPV